MVQMFVVFILLCVIGAAIIFRSNFAGYVVGLADRALVPVIHDEVPVGQEGVKS